MEDGHMINARLKYYSKYYIYETLVVKMRLLNFDPLMETSRPVLGPTLLKSKKLYSI